MHDDYSARLELALSAAREAGELTLRYFQEDNYAVELKRDQSPVTIADRQAEQLLRERIAAAFPADAIVGEEFPDRPGDSGYRWILDPIDGTKSFISGVPLYGALVGVEFDGQSVAGVIHIPALAETAYAAKGKGAWFARGDRPAVPARVSRTGRLADCLFCTSEIKSFARSGRRAAFEQFDAACRLVRTWGDCYGYLLVATGRADVMVDPLMNVWDCAALQPILEEAGGTFTDWQGHPTIYGGEAVATNGLVLDEALAIARRFPREPK
ncbi:MAG TPA: histidinol-phosphatase [Pirellulales bacterium]|nr:histidinol-phosphatase [Pirellulales bacterium]